MNVVRVGAVAPRPWRNGGGVTRELLAVPAGSDWRVRVSVADVATDGPFSAFPGVARWFAVLDGAGVELTIDGAVHRLAPGDAPLAFDGAARTTCRPIAGPTRDLNLMLRGVAGRLVPARDGARRRPGLGQCGLFTSAGGRCDADGTAGIELPPGSLAWFDRAPAWLAFTAAAPGLAWWIDAGAAA